MLVKPDRSLGVQGQPAPVGEFLSKAPATARTTCPMDLPFKILVPALGSLGADEFHTVR